MKKSIFIEGMSCKHCVERVKTTSEQLEGVTHVKVSFRMPSCLYCVNISDKLFIDTITNTGYKVTKIV